jgi:hypothetical protein
VAYTAPTTDASGQTWANLQSRGFSGHAKALLAAQTTNAPSFTATQLAGMMLDANKADLAIERAQNVIDNYTTGKADKASTKTYLFDLQQVFAALAATCGEAGVLVDAN